VPRWRNAPRPGEATPGLFTTGLDRARGPLRHRTIPGEKGASSESQEHVSVANLLICLGFAIWVSVCAAAPEFIWQGLLELLGHFSAQTGWSIVLIGLILTVFVEPIMERARDGRWQPERRNRRSLLFTAPIAFIFGLAAVGLHECMTALLEAKANAPDMPAEGMVRATKLILEWACIPLAVTMAWFSGREQRPVRLRASAAAAVWVIAAGWYFDWPLPGVVITSIPCLVLIPLGQGYVARNWNEDTFRDLAIGLAVFGGLWMVVTWISQAALWLFGLSGVQFYADGDLGENFRFYLGWAMGLALAPNPVPAHVPRIGG
jgi:hypothetical protein